MGRTEKRRSSRIRCNSLRAHIVQRTSSQTALVADVSLRGIRLVGSHLPAAGAWVSLELDAAPYRVPLSGHVVWGDHTHDAIGVAFEPLSARQRRDLGAAMLQVAFEVEADRGAALIFVEDPTTRAELCEPLRRHGYVPCVVTTPLEATVMLGRERPHFRFAILSPRPAGPTGVDAHDVIGHLANEYPSVGRIVIGEPATPREPLADYVLSSTEPSAELDALLDRLG